MTPADLSASISLGLLILSIYCFAWCVNSFLCPRNLHEAAWDDAEQALHRANRDVEQRTRLRLAKE